MDDYKSGGKTKLLDDHEKRDRTITEKMEEWDKLMEEREQAVKVDGTGKEGGQEKSRSQPQ